MSTDTHTPGFSDSLLGVSYRLFLERFSAVIPKSGRRLPIN